MCSYKYILATAPSLVALPLLLLVCYDHVHAKSLIHNVAVTCVVVLHWVSLLLGRQDTSIDFKVVWILNHPPLNEFFHTTTVPATRLDRTFFGLCCVCSQYMRRSNLCLYPHPLLLGRGMTMVGKNVVMCRECKENTFEQLAN